MTVDIVEPIPEEMAYNLSLIDDDDPDEEKQSVTKAVPDFDGSTGNRQLTPTATVTENDPQIDIEVTTKVR